MTLENVRSPRESILAAAVVASLVYLALQVGQGVLSARAVGREQIAASPADLNARLGTDPKAFGVFHRGLTSPHELDADEPGQLTMLFYGIFGIFESCYHVDRSGSIRVDAWDRWHMIALWYARLPGLQEWWRSKVTPFSVSFATFIEIQARITGAGAAAAPRFAQLMRRSEPSD